MAIAPLMKRRRPSFNRSPQALIHRLRKERDVLKSSLANAVINKVSQKQKTAKSVSPISTSINSQLSANKRKRSSLNDKNIGTNVAGQFRDPNDIHNRRKIYAGIKIHVFSFTIIIIKIIFRNREAVLPEQ